MSPRPAATNRPTVTATFAPLVHFFMHASVPEATQALDVAKAILASRAAKANGTNGAAATPRKRDRTRKPAAGNGGPTGVVAGTTAAAPAGDKAAPAKRGPGRPRGPRPAVGDATAAVAGAGDVPGAVVEGAAHAALPDQGVPEGE